MSEIIWSSYGKYKGPLYKGSLPFNPPEPHTQWQKILGVISDCEGKFDTVVMHDGTGVTAGFMQWTFTSGRLQNFINLLRTIKDPGMLPGKNGYQTIFEMNCLNHLDIGRFIEYGFDLKEEGLFDIANNKILIPLKDKDRIIEVCLGKTKEHAEGVLSIMIDIMRGKGTSDAQIYFAEKELKESLPLKRAVLGKHSTIDNLLAGSWDTPAPALFFNLYQNNPRASFNLFINAKESNKELFEAAWELLEQSTFGNWSYNSENYKKYKKVPRMERIRKSLNKYYNLNL